MNKHSFLSLFLACTALFFTACDDDNNNEEITEPVETSCELISVSITEVEDENEDEPYVYKFSYVNGKVSKIEATNNIDFHQDYTIQYNSEGDVEGFIYNEKSEYNTYISKSVFSYDELKRVNKIIRTNKEDDFAEEIEEIILKYDGDVAFPYEEVIGEDEVTKTTYDAEGNLLNYEETNYFYKNSATYEYSDKVSPLSMLLENKYIANYIWGYIFDEIGVLKVTAKHTYKYERRDGDEEGTNISTYTSSENEQGLVNKIEANWGDEGEYDIYNFEYYCE